MRIAPPALRSVVHDLLHDKRKRARWGLVIVTLFLVFEVTVRHLPPDGVTVTDTTYSGIGPSPAPRTTDGWYEVGQTTTTTRAQTSATERAAIDRLNSALNTAPVSATVTEFFVYGCDALGWDGYQVVLTWHGLPVQVWTTSGECSGFMENSGGVPNVLWTCMLPQDGQAVLNALAR